MANDKPIPYAGGIPGRPYYIKGSKSSVEMLEKLQFDPIQELVKQYDQIEREIEYQEKIRSGEVILLGANGRPKGARDETLVALYKLKQDTADKLLRYRYARVPENVEPPKTAIPSLIVNLTKKGEVYKANNIAPQPQPEDDWDAEWDEGRDGEIKESTLRRSNA